MHKSLRITLIILLLLAAAFTARLLVVRRQDVAFSLEKIKQGPLPGEKVAADFNLSDGPEPTTFTTDSPAESPPEAPKIIPSPDPETPVSHDPPETTYETEIPDAETVADNIPETPETPSPDPVSLPDSINLNVPFVLQAPFAVWDAVDDDACEEASVIMVKGYLDGESDISKDEMRERIDAIVAHEMETLGYFEDTNAYETSDLLTTFYGVPGAQVLPLASIEDVKRELAAGHPVILPAYGKALQNPFFRGGGPDYHMLVAKGYTSTHIITNDPGTIRGEDFLYTYDILWDAIHDWNDGNVTSGAKLMIVVK